VTRSQRQFIACITTQAVIIPIAMAVYFLVSPAAGDLTSVFGEVAVIFGWLLYIAIFDSRRKWPNVGWFTRLSYVLTFQR
jgi:hypothetical protein